MIEILNFQDGLPGTPTLGTFSVYIPSYKMTIHKFRVIRTKTGKLIIGYPSYRTETMGINGKPTYLPYFEFSKEKGLEFDQAVMNALKPYLKHASV